MTSPDLEQRLVRARRAGPTWNAQRQQELAWAVTAAAQPKGTRLNRYVAGITATLVLVGFVGWQYFPGGGRPSSIAGKAQSAGIGGTIAARSEVVLADGSHVIPDGPNTQLEKTAELSDDVRFDLKAGGATFDVARRPTRTFRVHSGGVTVQVIGTRFRVERRTDCSLVEVQRGRVLVSWWGGSREIAAGESGVFPPETETPAPVAATEPTGSPVRSRASATARRITDPPHLALPMSAANLLFKRADEARAEGKPEAAVPFLREIVDKHTTDAQAPMAAFTLGRLYLESLGRPRAAAAAFARARSLSRSGLLAEDALAREVEALHSAGEQTSARKRAELYRTLFPRGVRLATVLAQGGLSPNP